MEVLLEEFLLLYGKYDFKHSGVKHHRGQSLAFKDS